MVVSNNNFDLVDSSFLEEQEQNPTISITYIIVPRYVSGVITLLFRSLFLGGGKSRV